MTIRPPRFMRSLQAQRAAALATTEAGDRLADASSPLTLANLREAQQTMRDGRVASTNVPGFGPAYQLDGPIDAVTGLHRDRRFCAALTAGEFKVSDQPWWGPADKRRLYVLMKAEPSTVVEAE
jgi:hypothetical protein